jgi:heme exporter protein C
MLRHWWKGLTVLLLLYVLVFSFTTKLAPGLIGVDQARLEPGNNERVLVGYNTSFADENANPQIFLEHEGVYFCTSISEVISNDRIRFTVTVPDTLQVPFFNVYANSNIDGTVLLENAFSVSGASIGASPQAATCQPKVDVNAHIHFGFPFQPIIFESIRNLMFHVPMWFTMFLIMLISFVSSIRYLYKPRIELDLRALTAVKTGMLFAVLGLVTGSIWARFTWGAWWVNDPQLNGALVTFLIYAGYLILRSGIADDQKQARVAAVFNIFAYVILFILLMILPRFTEGLHPGKGGNPGFNSYDLDSSLRLVFYPAVLGWMLLGYWMYHLNLRMNRIRTRLYYDDKDLFPSSNHDKKG